jgi:hypothetical protein
LAFVDYLLISSYVKKEMASDIKGIQCIFKFLIGLKLTLLTSVNKFLIDDEIFATNNKRELLRGYDILNFVARMYMTFDFLNHNHSIM